MSDDEGKSGDDSSRWGTIFLGPTSDRESTIDKMVDSQQRELWNRRTEAEYMARVRARATLRVESMLEKARSNAKVIRGSAEQWADQVKARCEALHAEARQERDTAESIRKEAEKLRESAYEDGYQRGVEQAMMELEEHRAGLDMTTAIVLRAIQGQCAGVSDFWRDELVALLREAVGKSVGWVLSEERGAVLAGLLGESIQALENRQRIRVRVHPEDQAAVEDVLGSAQRRFADLMSWDVLADPDLTPGGLVVESASGKVDAGVEVRREVVDQALYHLTLPRGEADDAAEAAVAAEADAAGLTRLLADVEAEALRREQAEAERTFEGQMPDDQPPVDQMPMDQAPEDQAPEDRIPDGRSDDALMVKNAPDLLTAASDMEPASDQSNAPVQAGVFESADSTEPIEAFAAAAAFEPAEAVDVEEVAAAPEALGDAEASGLLPDDAPANSKGQVLSLPELG